MADFVTSFTDTTGYSIPSPEHLASYVLVFLIGLAVASSSTFRSQLSILVPRSSKDAQPVTDISISEVENSNEPELLNK